MMIEALVVALLIDVGIAIVHFLAVTKGESNHVG